MIDYYNILEIDEYSSKEEIRKQYKKLSLKYHPDKNNNDSSKFLEIKDAYDILIDDNKRNIYDYQRRFKFLKDFNLDEYEINYINSLYEKINNSYEVRFCKILFNTLPKEFHDQLRNLKESIFSNDTISKEIIIPPKYINVENLEEDYTINLNINFDDCYNLSLKSIIIHTKDCIYYLFLRVFNDIILKNGKHKFKIHFNIINFNNLYKKGNDLVIVKNINIYELLFKKEYELNLPDSTIISFIKNKSNIYCLKNKGLYKSYDYKVRGNIYIIFNLDYSKDYSEHEIDIQRIFN